MGYPTSVKRRTRCACSHARVSGDHCNAVGKCACDANFRRYVHSLHHKRNIMYDELMEDIVWCCLLLLALQVLHSVWVTFPSAPLFAQMWILGTLASLCVLVRATVRRKREYDTPPLQYAWKRIDGYAMELYLVNRHWLPCCLLECTPIEDVLEDYRLQQRYKGLKLQFGTVTGWIWPGKCVLWMRVDAMAKEQLVRVQNLLLVGDVQLGLRIPRTLSIRYRIALDAANKEWCTTNDRDWKHEDAQSCALVAVVAL